MKASWIPKHINKMHYTAKFQLHSTIGGKSLRKVSPCWSLQFPLLWLWYCLVSKLFSALSTYTPPILKIKKKTKQFVMEKIEEPESWTDHFCLHHIPVCQLSNAEHAGRRQDVSNEPNESLVWLHSLHLSYPQDKFVSAYWRLSKFWAEENSSAWENGSPVLIIWTGLWIQWVWFQIMFAAWFWYSLLNHFYSSRKCGMIQPATLH